MDFDFVSTRIATGAALTSPADVDAIVAAGVSFVVDARAEFDDGPLFAGRADLAYLWNPTDDDGQHKTVDYWARTLDFALPFLARPHHKGLFHCWAGCNRGPSNALCVLVALGWTPGGALALIKAARPQAQVAYRDDAAAACAALGYC